MSALERQGFGNLSGVDTSPGMISRGRDPVGGLIVEVGHGRRLRRCLQPVKSTTITKRQRKRSVPDPTADAKATFPFVTSLGATTLDVSLGS
nr:hypothetical protein [Streptomyces pseudovenezuelae]